MTDRYDEQENNAQGRRWERREGREGYARGEFGREESEYQNRGRGPWGNEQERFGRGEAWRERYGEPYYGGQRGERDWEQRGPNWQPGRMEWGRERTSREAPWGSGSRGFGSGPEYGLGSSGYTGYGASGSTSYSGGAGTYGQQQRGRFTGRGPKGYQRSDDRIREDVCERLTQDPDIDATEIEIKVQNGEVTLAGIVDERHSKRLAEEVAENVAGVKDVHNQVRVREREMAGVQHQTRGETSSKESTREKELTGQRR